MPDTSSVSAAIEATRQEPFERIVPLLKGALLLGVCGGMALAFLTLSRAFSLSTGTWWYALGQAYNDLLLYGWVGFLMIGIVFHFLPRVCRTPLPAPWLVSWIVAVQIVATLMRLLSQPLLAITGKMLWRVLLLLSGALECTALIAITVMFALLVWRGLVQAMKPTLRGMLPFLLCAFVSLALAALVNVTNTVQAAFGMGLVQGEGDSLNGVLGLFGFVIPIALALSIRLLPLYGGLRKFPQHLVWPLAAMYIVGLALTGIGVSWVPIFAWLSIANGVGMVLLSVVLLAFVAIFVYLAYPLKRLLGHGAQFSPSSRHVVREDEARGTSERSIYGPFLHLIASAYLWGTVSALLLASRGVALLVGAVPNSTWDSVFHSFTSGFVVLLLAGFSVRMLPNFSGRSIAGPAWITTLLWVGNTVALLSVGLTVLLPIFVSWGNRGITLYALLFGLSGPIGLAFAVCLLGTLWPTLKGTEMRYEEKFF